MRRAHFAIGPEAGGSSQDHGLWGASGSWESKGADFLLGLLDGNVAQPTP